MIAAKLDFLQPGSFRREDFFNDDVRKKDKTPIDEKSPLGLFDQVNLQYMV